MSREQARQLAPVVDHSAGQVDDARRSRRPVELDTRFPELAPLLPRAMSAVIDTLSLSEETSPGWIRELEHAAATAMIEAYEPFAETASELVRAIETIRTTKADGVRRAAQMSASLVAETAAALRQRHDQVAQRAAEQASTAARAASSSSVPGLKADARQRAMRQADAVRAAADARAAQQAAAAALTAEAARQAELQLAIAEENAAAIVHRDAVEAADALRATALIIMYEVAVEAACWRYSLAI